MQFFWGEGVPFPKPGNVATAFQSFSYPAYSTKKELESGAEREKTFSPDLFGKTMPKMPEPEIEGSIIQRTHKRPRMFVLFVCGIYQRQFSKLDWRFVGPIIHTGPYHTPPLRNRIIRSYFGGLVSCVVIFVGISFENFRTFDQKQI